MIGEREDGGSEGSVGVGQAEEGVEEVVRPGGPPAERLARLREAEEVVDSGKEEVDRVEPGGGGAAVDGGGSDLVEEVGDDRVGAAWQAAGPQALALIPAEATEGGDGRGFGQLQRERAAESGDHRRFNFALVRFLSALC